MPTDPLIDMPFATLVPDSDYVHGPSTSKNATRTSRVLEKELLTGIDASTMSKK